MRQASAEAVSASTPDSTSSLSKKRCLDQRLLGKMFAGSGQANIVVNHLSKPFTSQVAERLGDARLGDAHMLRDVDVAASPALPIG